MEVGATPGRLAAPDGAAGSGADVVGSQLDASGLAGDAPPGVDVLVGLDAMTAEDARADAAEDASQQLAVIVAAVTELGASVAEIAGQA